jgi:putative MATE family efflux protein
MAEPRRQTLTRPEPTATRGITGLPGTVRPVLRLVLPVLLEQLLGLTVGFTDKWLAGNLFDGEEPLAAVGLVAYCLAFLPVPFALPAVAVTALVARAVGAGDRPAARRAAAQALLVGTAVVAGVSGLLLLAGGTFLGWLGLPPGSTALAGRYLAIVLPVLPAMMLIHVGMAALRGAGAMVAGLVGMTVVNLVNAGASFALATGLGGLPRLGWEGLAWGTAAGYLAGATCVAVLLARRLGPRAADWRPDRSTLRRIVRIGLPAGGDALANAACHLTFLSIVNRLGDVAAAAHSVAVTIESLAFLPGTAFQVAAATLAGQFLGARDERRARGSVWLATIACLTFMTCAAAGFLWFADTLAAWFTGGAGSQPAVAALTAKLVRIVAFAQPPLALLMVLSGGLRGGGATRPPLVVNFVGLLAIRLPLAALLASPQVDLPAGLGTLQGAGWGAVGAWIAMATDLTARGLAMLIIFSRVRWTRVAV